MQDQGDIDFQLPCPLLSVELFNEISLDLRQWTTSFAPLYSRTWDYDSLEFLSASFICIQALSSDLTLRGMHFGEKGLRTTKVEKLAERIVDLAKLIVSNRRFHKKFTCETGVIAALCSVCQKGDTTRVLSFQDAEAERFQLRFNALEATHNFWTIRSTLKSILFLFMKYFLLLISCFPGSLCLP